MISTHHKFIYLHVPKTGGNAIQNLLVPFSDDQKISGGFRDGTDRFEISGPVTSHKHATLEEYQGNFERDMFLILISVRHPFSRAVSAYFSPHRWYENHATQGWIPRQPDWDEAEFMKLLSGASLRPATQFLRLGTSLKTPDLIIKTEDFEHGIKCCETLLNLHGKLVPNIQKANVTHAPTALYNKILQSKALQQHVESVFEADMSFFGYDSYKYTPPKGAD